MYRQPSALAVLLAIQLAAGCSSPAPRSVGQDAGARDSASDRATAASDPTAALYDPQVVQRIELEIGAAELQTMRDALPERVYVRGTFRWGDVELRDVGVRYKGNSSSQPQQRHKRSFLIKFGEYVDGQRFLGLRRVALDNGVQFGSLFSERILGDVLRERDVIVPRSNYATLQLNGEFLGVYVNVERIDRSFLDRTFEDPRGNLYKADTGGPGSSPACRTSACSAPSPKSCCTMRTGTASPTPPTRRTQRPSACSTRPARCAGRC